MENLNKFEKRENLIVFLGFLINEGIHFDYRHIVRWDNAKPSYEEILKHNEEALSSNDSERSTINSRYPATLAVFQNEGIDYKLDGYERFIICKSYLTVQPIYDLLKFKRELLSPLEWRLSNYLTYILNVSLSNELEFANYEYRETKENILRFNFKTQFRKIIRIIQSNHILYEDMKFVGNYNVNQVFSEYLNLIDSKLKWNLIFNEIFDVKLNPGWLSITVKEDKKEALRKIQKKFM